LSVLEELIGVKLLLTCLRLEDLPLHAGTIFFQEGSQIILAADNGSAFLRKEASSHPSKADVNWLLF
jgi:hypothetical protein